MVWRKSSRSSGDGNNCVEVAALPYGVAVRDSKNPDSGYLTLATPAWAALLGRLRG
jgi:hypothetical protein